MTVKKSRYTEEQIAFALKQAGDGHAGRRSAAADGDLGAFIESFNGRLRDECLNAHWFLSLVDARAKIEAWRRHYGESRPHTTLGWMTPSEYAAAVAQKATE